MTVSPRQADLEQELTLIKEDLEAFAEAQNYKAIDEFLNYSEYLMAYINVRTKQLVGFNIDVIDGGPYVNLEYTRGWRCVVIGYWRGINLTKDVNTAACEAVLERLESYLNNSF
ncbi:MAG: hypothetical protein RXR16_03510 [Thermocladium sp.]